MTQTSNRLFDDLAKMMTDAAGAAEGMKKEVESMMKAQAERFMNSMDVVKREEFEVVKAMAQKAREENEALKARLAELEARSPAADRPIWRAGIYCPAAQRNWPYVPSTEAAEFSTSSCQLARLLSQLPALCHFARGQGRPHLATRKAVMLSSGHGRR